MGYAPAEIVTQINAVAASAWCGGGARRPRPHQADTATGIDLRDYFGRRVPHAMAATPKNATAASGRPTYQRSRSRARARK